MGPMIEHNPHERRFTKRYVWYYNAMVAVVWALMLLSNHDYGWRGIGLGFLTGIAFIVTAVQYSGGRIPEWYRRMYD